MSSVGVGVITCNRQEFYEKCLSSIQKCNVDSVVTINDGAPYSDIQVTCGEYFRHTANKGVGVTKNEAITHLLSKGCEHIFLIEDDIIVKDPDVFNKYIETSRISGLKHLMFGYHGPANKHEDKTLNPRLRVDYSPDHSVAFNTHCVGAFCYYHKSVIEQVGLMDENFKNAWEHVDHSLQIVKAGFIPSYWWWPDVANSCDYLDELACSEESSTIRWEDSEKRVPKKDWLENIEKGAQYFYKKNKCLPTQVEQLTESDLITTLKQIKEKYTYCEV